MIAKPRLFTQDEIEDVIAFQHEAYDRIASQIGATPIPLEWDYHALLAQCETWGIEDDQGLTAALILRRDDEHLCLESVATADRAAGKGLGAQMMAFAIERAKQLGYRHIRLITNSRNPAAQWYKRLGFEVEHEDIQPKRTVLHFVKGVS